VRAELAVAVAAFALQLSAGSHLDGSASTLRAPHSVSADTRHDHDRSDDVDEHPDNARGANPDRGA